MQRKILAVSLSADILFNDEYKQLLREGKTSEQAVIEANKIFLGSIAAKRKSGGYTSLVFFVGDPDCQSYEQDKKKSEENGTGSFFPAIESVAQYAEGSHSPLLLADSYINKGYADCRLAGSSFSRARHVQRGGTYFGKHVSAIVDYTYISVIYAQTHHIVNENPLVPIEYILCCDSRDCNALKDAGVFLTKDENGRLIPQNVNVWFYHDDIQEKNMLISAPIQGTGSHHEHYLEIARKITVNAVLEDENITKNKSQNTTVKYDIKIANSITGSRQRGLVEKAVDCFLASEKPDPNKTYSVYRISANSIFKSLNFQGSHSCPELPVPSQSPLQLRRNTATS